MPKQVIIGIDPGLLGGIIITEDGEVVVSRAMPVIKFQMTTKYKKGKKKGQFKTQKRIDAFAIAELFSSFPKSKIFVEKAAPMFGVGTNTNFRIGQSAGALEGVARVLGIEWIEVKSRLWQKEIWIDSDLVERVKIDEGTRQTKRDTKATSLNAFNRLRGSLCAIQKGCSTPHDGIVDAFLIAEYGRQQ